MKRFLIVFILSILTAYQIFFSLNVLKIQQQQIQISLNPVFELISALVWVLILSALIIRNLKKYPNSKQHSWILILCFVGWNLLRYSVFAKADYDRGRIPFILVIYLIAGSISAVVIWRKSIYANKE